MSNIIYALVARDRTVLCEYTSRSGNFTTIVRVLLSKITSDRDGRMSYVQDEYAFHYEVHEGMTYLCMADRDMQRRIPFEFLADIRNRFRATYGDRGQTAIAFTMNEDFGRVLQKQMEYFNDPANNQYSQVQSKIADVKNVMVENIERVLERGEKLELLVDKSDKLAAQSFKFQRQSKKLKDAMWWKKVKMYLLFSAVAAVLFYVLLAFICGPTFKKC